jgi:hypothetical protein
MLRERIAVGKEFLYANSVILGFSIVKMIARTFTTEVRVYIENYRDWSLRRALMQLS